MTEQIKPGKDQVLPYFFERVFFPDGMILKIESHYKGSVVIKEIQELNFGEVLGLEQALQNVNLSKIRLRQ